MTRLETRTLVVLASLALASPALADLAEIKASGVLRVVAVKEEAPEMFSFSDTGEPGFEREIIEGFARLQGVKVQPVPAVNADERIVLLNKGAGDVIIGIVVTEARKKLVDFSSEVLPSRHVVVSYQPQPPIETLEAFRAAKVGVVKGTSWAQAAVEAGVPAGSLESFGDRYEAFDALKAGRIGATVITLSDYTLALRKYPGAQAGLTLGASTVAAMAVRKGDDQLLAALDEYLENFRKGPSWSRLVVKYFGEKALAVLGRK